MARSGITFSQVEQAADTLLGEAKQPTIRSVRDLLGTGSPNTIHKHLQTWQAARPAPQATTRELDGEISKVIIDQMERIAAESRAGIESKLVESQAAANELATIGEALETERDELAEQITTLTTERDQFQATAAERAAEIERHTSERSEETERLGKEIARERQSAEFARVELAKTQLKIESQNEKLAEQKIELERLHTEYKADLKQLSAGLETERKKCQQAEQNAAVATAQFTAEKEARKTAEAREIEALKRITAAENTTKNAQQAEQLARIAGQAAQTKLEAAAREIEGANTAQIEAKAAREEAAELRGRIKEILEKQQ